ncbi:MAG TPA: hypothetical protein VHE53_03205 [Patescibacteria group bacterium]|nr:hypothetical protein [Patescibacteria group bacterium]
MNDTDKEALEKAKEEEKLAAKIEEDKKKAEQAWKEFNEQREREGKKVTEEEKINQRILINKGVMPKIFTALFSDFSLAIVAKPQNEEILEKFKKEFAEQVGAGAVDKKDTEEARQKIEELKNQKKITSEQEAWLDDMVRAEAAHHEKNNQISEEMGEDYGKAIEARKKKSRKEELNEEEKKLSETLLEKGYTPDSGGGAPTPRAIDVITEGLTEKQKEELLKKWAAELDEEKTKETRKQAEHEYTTKVDMKPKSDQMKEIFRERWYYVAIMNGQDTKDPAVKAEVERRAELGPPGDYNASSIATIDALTHRFERDGVLRGQLEDYNSELREKLRSLSMSTIGRRGLASEEARKDAASETNELVEELLEESVGDGADVFAAKFKERVLKKVYDKVDRAAREGRGLEPYQSITEIARDIMIMTGGKFARGGEFALLKTDVKTGQEVFQQANFLEWIRNRLVYYHENDVDNPVDMFQRIAISGGARNVSIMEMLDNQAMFSSDGTYHETLRDQVLYEVWLFNTSRDISAIYRKVRGDDEKLPETLAEIYRRNTFTKSGTMDRILTLPDAQGGIDFSNKDSMRENQRTGHALRRALNIYYNIADYEMVREITGENSILLSNKEFIEAYLRLRLPPRSEFKSDEAYRLARKDAIFAALEKVQYTDRYLDKSQRALTDAYIAELRGTTADEQRAFDSKTNKYSKLVDKIQESIHQYETGSGTGTLAARRRNIDPKTNSRSLFKEPTEAEARAAGMKLDAYRKMKIDEASRRYDYMDAINIFNASMKDIGLMTDTQEKIRLFIQEKSAHDVDVDEDGKKITKTMTIASDDAYYAETFANTMMHWGGGAAKNDTSSVGFDSWTKVLATKEYRERQTAAGRGGVHGNIYNFPGYMQLGVDFFTGVTDLDGRSVLEIIQGGQGRDISNIDKNIDEIRFGDDTMNHFASDHVTRTFKLFHNIVETHEYNFDSFITVDQWGQLVFDPTKANEVMDGMFKAFRYPYNTWTGLDFSKLVVRRNLDTGAYETKTMAEIMFGEEIWRDFVEMKRKELDKKPSERTGANRTKSVGQIVQENRGEFYKYTIMYSIAAEMRAHRIYGGGYRKYKTAQVEAIYKFLETFAGDLEYNGGDIKDIRRSQVKRFFTPEQIKWMRMHSGTGVWAVYFSEYAGEGLSGIWEGFIKALKILGGSLDKV